MSTVQTMKRISARKKEEIVLRLLQGESIETLSRELKVSVGDIENWKRRFLISAREGLKTHGKEPIEKELELDKKTIGELTMELNLYKKKEDFIQQNRGHLLSDIQKKQMK